jgi:hypothetical protein
VLAQIRRNALAVAVGRAQLGVLGHRRDITRCR